MQQDCRDSVYNVYSNQKSEQSYLSIAAWCGDTGLITVGCGSTVWTCRRRQKVVVLRELHRAIIYTTEMSKQVTKSHVRDAVHMYPVN